MTLTASPPFRAVPAQQSPPYACRHGLAISRWVKGTVSSHMAWSCSSRECLACQHLHGVSCAAAVALSDIDLRTDCTPLPGRLIMMSIIRCWRSIVLRSRSSMAMSSRSGSECCTLFAACCTLSNLLPSCRHETATAQGTALGCVACNSSFQVANVKSSGICCVHLGFGSTVPDTLLLCTATGLQHSLLVQRRLPSVPLSELIRGLKAARHSSC
jgi:hypothetical protein